MKLTRADERKFETFNEDGADKLDLWNEGHEVSAQIYRFPKGSSYPAHTHETWEQMYIISGSLKLSGVTLSAGDYAFTEPGETHAVENLVDTVVLLSFGKSI